MTGLPDHFWAKVQKTETCWLWTGTVTSKGYALTTIKHKTTRAHRLAYKELVGPIPDGWDIDHLCRVTGCVRPEHLEAVTPAENRRRQTIAAAAVSGSTCKKGHPLVATSRRRVCRVCDNERSRVGKRRRRAQRALLAA